MLTAGAKDNHLEKCKGRLASCGCRAYMYNTVPELIEKKIVATIVSYIINFEYARTDYQGNSST